MSDLEPIPILNLVWLLIPVLVVAYIYSRWVGKKWEIAYASLRMAVQLILVGFVLSFVFTQKNPWLSMSVIILMITVSSAIALRNIENRNIGIFRDILISILVGGGVNLIIVVALVLQLDPWYEARYIIPLSGMIFANGMNTVSLAAERFYSELEIKEDFIKARYAGFRAAMIPQINVLLAVGLVSLPGMMTGQILSGISPLIAVRYQIMVMCMILGTAGLTTMLFFALRKRCYQLNKCY